MPKPARQQGRNPEFNNTRELYTQGILFYPVHANYCSEWNIALRIQHMFDCRNNMRRFP